METIKNKTFLNVLKGTIIALITTLVLLIVFSVILTYTNISENTIDPVIITITAISILIGSSIGNKKIKKNGLLNGIGVGGAYILTIYLISSTLNWNFSINFETFLIFLIGIVFGAIGGIIGVNVK